MPDIKLILGAGYIDRIIPNADALLLRYRKDPGSVYMNYQPITPSDQVVPEDLAITLLLNSRVSGQAVQSLVEHGHEIDLTRLPKKSLEHTTPEERVQIAALIAQVAKLPGFAASVATKLLHKKRPELIPILDNQAIIGAYLNPNWPAKPASTESVKNQEIIQKALNWIAFDITRPENEKAWKQLHDMEPGRPRTELFGSVWWMVFKTTQAEKK